MPEFRVKGLDQGTGQTTELTIEAPTADDARQQGEFKGLVVTDIVEPGKAIPVEAPPPPATPARQPVRRSVAKKTDPIDDDSTSGAWFSIAVLVVFGGFMLWCLVSWLIESTWKEILTDVAFVIFSLVLCVVVAVIVTACARAQERRERLERENEALRRRLDSLEREP